MIGCLKHVHCFQSTHNSEIKLKCNNIALKGDKKKPARFKKYFDFLKILFLLKKSFGCQRKSFRSWTKENFDTCPRSEGFIITELCHFLWDQFMLTQHESKFKNCKKMDVQNVIFRQKCYISVNMSPTDLRQVSKFSFVQYLKLFLWHPKDLVCRKNVLGEEKISSFHCKLFTMASFKKKGLKENGITQWLWVFQTWDRCQNFPWFNT